jgi:hypothetical protein
VALEGLKVYGERQLSNGLQLACLNSQSGNGSTAETPHCKHDSLVQNKHYWVSRQCSAKFQKQLGIK